MTMTAVERRLPRSPAVGLAVVVVAVLGIGAPARGARIELISKSSVQPPGGTPSGPSTLGGVSADGRFVVFASRAADVVAGQIDRDHYPGDVVSPSSWDVFLRDRVRQTTTLVSHGSASIRAAGGVAHDSRGPAISADGNWIVFASKRRDLVPGQVGNDGYDVFLYDRLRNTNILVSHRFNSPLTDSNEQASAPAMSADGRYVAYYSYASDIVAGDFVTDKKLFLFDRLTGVNALVDRGNGLGGDIFERLRLSIDGRFLAFTKNAQIYVYDRLAATIALVSHAAGLPATPGNHGSSFHEMSADGGVITYMSTAADLVTGQIDGAETWDIFVYEREADRTTLASRSSASAVTAANAGSTDVTISADGRFVAFLSQATDLVAGVSDANQSYDEFVYDRTADRLSLISHADGAPMTAANRPAYSPSLSPDGSRLTFTSAATDVVAGLADPSPWFNLFVSDRASGAATLIGVQDRLGPIAQGISARPQFSADGQAFVFGGPDGLVAADANLDWDVYFFGEEPPSPTPFIPCTLLDTHRAADGPALRSEVKRLVVVGGACEIPAGAKWITVKVTASQATGKGSLRLFPGNQSSAAGGVTLPLKKGATRTATYQLRLATDGAGTLAILPFVAGRGTVHAVVEIQGYSE